MSVGPCFSLTAAHRGQWRDLHLPSPSILYFKTDRSCSQQIIVSLTVTCLGAEAFQIVDFQNFRFGFESFCICIMGCLGDGTLV